jgi:hypothetical protein
MFLVVDTGALADVEGDDLNGLVATSLVGSLVGIPARLPVPGRGRRPHALGRGRPHVMDIAGLARQRPRNRPTSRRLHSPGRRGSCTR